MGDSDKLRPEVAEAVERMCTPMGTKYVYTERRDAACMATIRAELLRLADENKRMRGIIETLDIEGHRRAEKAEAELAESRETIKRLNRRVQVAEAGVVEKVKVSAPGSFGRALANAAADMYMRERDEAQAELAALKAGIAGAPTLVYGRDDWRNESLIGKRVALVPVED